MSALTLKQQQQVLTRHLRDPENNMGPSDVEDRRLSIYRDLFFKNIESFISSAFPIFRSLYNEAEWLGLVRDFFADYKCETPYFLEISEELLQYLEDDTLSIHQRYPFAKELCHYEWVELGLDIAEDEQQQNIGFDANGDLLQRPVLVSPVAWPLIYQWPVHEIGKNYIPSQIPEQPSCLVVYRTRLDKVEFLQTNPATIQLLHLINENPELTGEEVLQLLAEAMGQGDNPAIIQFGLQTLEQLKSMGIVLGTRCPPM